MKYGHGPFKPGGWDSIAHLYYCVKCHFEENYIEQTGQKCKPPAAGGGGEGK